jgi:hypothetical protein
MATRIYTPAEIRKQAALGLVAQLSGDKILAPIGRGMQKDSVDLTDINTDADLKDEQLALQRLRDEQGAREFAARQAEDTRQFDTKLAWDKQSDAQRNALELKLKQMGIDAERAKAIAENAPGVGGMPTGKLTEQQARAVQAIEAGNQNAGLAAKAGLPSNEHVRGIYERGLQQLSEFTGQPGLVPGKVQEQHSAWLGLASPIVRFKGGQNLTESEMQREALSMIPRPGDSPETQKQKLQRLHNEYRGVWATLPEDYRNFYDKKFEDAFSQLDALGAGGGETRGATGSWGDKPKSGFKYLGSE